MAKSNVVTTAAWKEQLDFDRACTSSGPHDRCWLTTELGPWNSVLYRLESRLELTCPGKLSLLYFTRNGACGCHSTVAAEAAFLISWLLEHHSCISELRVSFISSLSYTLPGPAPFPMRFCQPTGKGDRCLDLIYTASLDNGRRILRLEDMAVASTLNELTMVVCDAGLMPEYYKLFRCEPNPIAIRVVEVHKHQLSSSLADITKRVKMCQTIAKRFWPDNMDREASAPLIRSFEGVENFTFLAFGIEEEVSNLINALETNVTLTALDIGIKYITSSQKAFFAAIEMNATLKLLRFTGGIIDASCGPSFESLISKNSSLLELHFAAYVVDPCLIAIAEGLSQNTTLEKLHFAYKVPGMTGILSLCRALATNKTLKRIAFAAFVATTTERGVLAKKLADGGAYRRVVLPLAEPDLPPLVTCLSSLKLCPEEVGELNVCKVSDSNLKLFFDALTSRSCGVRTFSVCIDQNARDRTDALGEMLKKNRSIRSISIAIRNNTERVARKLLTALNENKNIFELDISIYVAEPEALLALSDFFTRNRTITMFRLWIQGMMDTEVAELLSHGMRMNPVIQDFTSDTGYPMDRIRCQLFKTLKRNRAALNRAVDFVLLRTKDRQSAQDFELFSGKPCLLAHVMKTSGRNQLEALHAIASADNFLADNYLVITGVIRCSLVCRPVGNGTQLDELNTDCWRAIARKLNVCDVIG